MTKNIVDLFLLDIIENHYNDIIYKSTASQFYKQFIDFCNLHDFDILPIQAFGILVKQYKSIYYHRLKNRYYTLIIQHLQEETRKTF